MGIRSHRAGQAAVEFALVGLLLAFVVAGIVDLSRAMRAYVALSNASREAARANTDRQCTTTTDANSPQQRAITAAPELNLGASATTVTYKSSAGATLTAPTTVPGDLTIVTVTYTFASSLPIIADLIAGTGLTTMTSTTTMAVAAVNATCA